MRGAGIVPGSTVQGEWTETSYKIGVISSIFPSSPLTLQSLPSPNIAWANAFVEELIRCGVTQFYVCPGSRSTPLVAALAKTLRANVGIIQAQSIHDERSAGFRALGYARGSGRPAAVITSSGTAVANLYPSIMEAGMDGVPMLLLTADRPYESRATGANQAVDQVKAFSSTYVRWFRDIPPPSDDVPVSLALSDADHAVTLSRTLRGPVHLNIQFRENLAPEGGEIRNDDRVGSITKFNGFRFTDVPGFYRWSLGGGRWSQNFLSDDTTAQDEVAVLSNAVQEVASLIMKSKRGMIVVGNVRASTNGDWAKEESRFLEMISNFAQVAGLPVFAGVQSGSLRFRCPAIVPYAEHLLKHASVKQNLKPDFVLQIGTPLVSTEIPQLIVSAMKTKEQSDEPILSHVLLHPHHPDERADPYLTVTHRIDSDIYPFLRSLVDHLESMYGEDVVLGSDLAPLVLLGQKLQKEMPRIIHEASDAVVSRAESSASPRSLLTEPQVVLAMREVQSESNNPTSLFLSNSMPVRDAEFFFYPGDDTEKSKGITRVGVNRGASGIDGVISSAAGFAESSETPTTLLIGDLAALHDINALHSLSGKRSPQSSLKNQHRLTTVVVDNDGGGIFSFLPVAKHGSDVNFEEFFGTPTSSFALDKAAEAFGLKYRQAWSYKLFAAAYRESIISDSPCILEATVVSREDNVLVHREITSRVLSFLDDTLKQNEAIPSLLPIEEYKAVEAHGKQPKTLVLLHGWMGDKSEWNPVATELARSLPSEWNILSVDLPGHGESVQDFSSDLQALRSVLGLGSDEDSGFHDSKLSINDLADRVEKTLRQRGVESIQALAGYSLGGRVSLALLRNSLDTQYDTNSPPLCDEDTQLVLLSAYPGELEPGLEDSRSENTTERARRDELLCDDIVSMANRNSLLGSRSGRDPSVWFSFLRRWYGAPLWGNLQKRKSGAYRQMVLRRSSTLNTRARDLAIVLRDSSPGAHATDDWKFVDVTKTLYVSGGLDGKYSRIGETWKSIAPDLLNVNIESVGHALLVEAPVEVSSLVQSFLTNQEGSYQLIKQNKEEPVGSNETAPSPTMPSTNRVLSMSTLIRKSEIQPDKGPGTTIWNQVTIGSLDFEKFSLDYQDDSSSGKPLGIGWGDSAKADVSRSPKTRQGLILQIVLSDGSAVGLGEVCPLASVHPESLHEAQNELETIQRNIQNMETLFLPKLDAASVLGMDGGLGDYIDDFLDALEVDSVSQSVRAGMEMALLSIAAQVVRMPLLPALVEYAPGTSSPNPGSFNALLPVNGLQMRGERDSAFAKRNQENGIAFPSLKVKVGHQGLKADQSAIIQALQQTSSMIRPDANRSWNMEAAEAFAEVLKQGNTLSRLEFVEEPLEKQSVDGKLQDQVKALEEFHQGTKIPYALDESIADLAALHHYDFDAVRQELLDVFSSGPRGCKALVLKPSLLGLELTMQIARLAKSELNMGAVVSSCFESGVGLAYAAFLGAAADQGEIPRSAPLSHGLGTFGLFRGDTLSPSFSSYVTNRGKLQVSSLSRALFGLGLDELRDSFIPERLLVPPETTTPPTLTTTSSSQESFTYQQSAGRELSVVVSLPLPFSDTIACARFTDLPQQTRWTPWLSSVAYLDTGEESEWTLNIRGVRFKWRATSKLLESPYRGIQWESVSGVKNVGVVEFIPTSADACLMKVRMTIVPPRIVATLFPPGASVFAEDFLQNKLLKWSLEMFRDTVKGDLALERGDVELGDALFGAAEGRANAIEATLSNPLTTNGRRVNEDEDDDEDDDAFSFE
jgi:2-succinyl-5-enolpyruvyl-6-hydroxy-3-cyclohexene-1-carboxylate synthase